jgi:hypothetical protein
MSKNKNKTKSKGQSASQQHPANPPTPAPIIVNVQPTPINCAESDDAKKYSLKWWKPRIEIFGICAAVIVVFVNSCQWVESKRQADTAETQLTNQMFDMRLDERAWLNIRNPVVQYPANQTGRFGLQVEYLNTGKTPAKIKSMHITIGTSKEPFTDTEWLVDTNVNPSGMLAPNGPQLSLWHVPMALDENMVDEVAAHRRRYYFVWDVFYEDVFTNIHETRTGFTVKAWMDDENGKILDGYGDEIMN